MTFCHHSSIYCPFISCLYSSGLNILYPGDAELNKLLKLVLTEGGCLKYFSITNTLTD